MSIVSVKKVNDYNEELLYDAVEEHFSVLGLNDKINAGMKVVIKPNLLSARKPEAVATTHPAVVLAIAKKLRSLGVSDIVVADSPGGPHVAAALSTVYSACGYKAIGDHVDLNYSVEWNEVKTQEGLYVQSFNIIEPICNADYIINVAKLKTHALTGMSGGVKNLFGCIPGLQKPEMHYRFPEIKGFSNMLVDLCETVAPDVTFIDAVVAMEGEGPNMGTPKQCGYFLASEDIYAQDIVASRIIGVEYNRIEMLRCAKERGLVDIDNISVVGDECENMAFVLPKSDEENYLSCVPSFMRGTLGFFAKRLIKPVPYVVKNKCIGCGKCAESCPQHIIEIQNKKAHIKNKGKCISCFCCQEMCPAHSITVKRRLKR